MFFFNYDYLLKFFFHFGGWNFKIVIKQDFSLKKPQNSTKTGQTGQTGPLGPKQYKQDEQELLDTLDAYSVAIYIYIFTFHVLYDT